MAVFGRTAVEIGVAHASLGVGSLIGAVIAPALGRRFAAVPLVCYCTVGTGVLTLVITLAHDLIAILGALAATAALGTLCLVRLLTLRQEIVPLKHSGKVVAITRMIAVCAVPLGALVAGLLVQMGYGWQITVWLAATIRMVTGAGGLVFFRNGWFERMPTPVPMEKATTAVILENR